MRIFNHKKIIITGIIISIFLIYPLLFTPNVFRQSQSQNLEQGPKSASIGHLIVGMGYGPWALDPHGTWDPNLPSYGSPSCWIQEQVVECLFTYNLSHPQLEIIPHLAKDYGNWSIDGLNYTVALKQGIEFHDGAPLNASAVKWNFDRLAYLINQGLAVAKKLYEFYDPNSLVFFPVINRTYVIDDYTIKFVLNAPYGPFEALLCFAGSSILSPTSTPASSIIDKNTGDLVGTGPFIYDNYVEDEEVNLHAFSDYWKGMADISTIKFKIIENSANRTEALLNGEIDMDLQVNTANISLFESNPDFKVDHTPGGVINYFGLSNYWINKTMRNAISYAINYTYIMEELLGFESERLMSPVPENILYSNYSYSIAVYNISKARMLMQSMGFGIGWDTTDGGANETEWSSATFATYNYTYNLGHTLREALGDLLHNSLDRIGIEIVQEGMSWGDFIYRFYNIPEQLQIFFLYNYPYLNDPYEMIQNPFANYTYVNSHNGLGYDNYQAAIEGGRDPTLLNDNVQLLLEAALFTHNKTLRAQYYNRAQQLLVEEDMPWAFAYAEHTYAIYRKEVSGFQVNGMRKVWLFDVETTLTSDRAPPILTINSPSESSVLGVSAPTFDVNIIESNLSYSWYSIFNGLSWTEDVFFTGSVGTIDMAVWNTVGNGTGIIRFYVNDTSGHLTYVDVPFFKDSIAPELVIHTPLDSQEFTNPPKYNISVTDPNLASLWYTVDNNPKIYLCTDVGWIDSTLWDSLSSGVHIIYFNANDTVGNLATESVTVTIPSTTAILGYYPLLLFMVIGMSSIVVYNYIQKKMKSKF